jgi:hypothetical protein
MTDLTVDTLRAELAPITKRLDAIETRLEHIEARLLPMQAQVAGIAVIDRKLTVIQQELRLQRAAVNDFARESVTPGEITALHTDVNTVMAGHHDLERRIATLERLLAERP